MSKVVAVGGAAVQEAEESPPKHDLMRNWKEENMTMFFLAGMTAAMGFSAFVVLKVKPSSLGYLGIVGLLSSALWMPYLMALIYINTDKGKPMSGLYKKLDYAPLTAEVPPWVKRAMVAHNNSLENFMLFAISIIYALFIMTQSTQFAEDYAKDKACIQSANAVCVEYETTTQFADGKIRGAAAFYFVMRCMYIIFTISPPIFMMKTATWCMGWGACAYIFCIGISYTEAAYEI